ncbi:hypothetical protein [Rubricoccus marinus]|uniref:Uncharacterized protein n=1 Tax=Rubricoccus marinus TaxID=716817 RepID=A0A259U2L6_9BACT|nr:hypothetical protein [Rubricoccus marinus]OZC04044.1 hypothetical protein BSZ36_14255 [Rubricoccus marinus]
MIRLAALALLLPLAACGAEEDPDLVLEGADPVQADGDLAPDATLAPEAEQAPSSDLAPEAELEPDAVIE